MSLLRTSEPEVGIDATIQEIADRGPQEKYTSDKNPSMFWKRRFFLYNESNLSKQCNQKGKKEEADFHLFETMYEDTGNPENALRQSSWKSWNIQSRIDDWCDQKKDTE